MSPRELRTHVLNHYKEHGRHTLPWRATRNPYRILVSEVMLQQTQVERVVPFYTEFLKRFPNVHALSAAPLSEVLRAWQGLGYNRRAKMLHEAAKAVVGEHKGKFPKTAAELVRLHGVGPYTAGAVAAFAFNEDALIIETNIRTVVTYHCFSDRDAVTDAEIFQVLKVAHPKGQARDWYWALMDYGSHLKRSGVRISGRAKGYVKQSAFKGSSRELRGQVLRTLAAGAATEAAILKTHPDRRDDMKAQLQKLTSEGLIKKEGRKYRLAD